MRPLRRRALVVTRVEALATDPRDRLLAVFDALKEWFATDDFRGCPLINTAAEIADDSHPVREACRAHKAHVHAWLRSLAVQAGFARPDDIAATLILLLDGATVSAVVSHAPAAADQAKAAAAALLAGAAPA